MAGQYMIPSGAAPTTSSFVAIACGTSLHTLLQIHLGDSATGTAEILRWGISFDASAAATPGIVELFAATGAASGMTAHAATSIIDLNAHAHRHDPNTDNNPFAYGTAETAFSDGTVTEGTPAVVRMLDVQHIAPTNQYVMPFSPPYPQFDPDDFVRIRVNMTAAVNAICYVVVRV